MEFKCPACQSIIYSRKHKVCGQCGAVLPAELLLTPAQLRILEQDEKRAYKRSQWSSSDGGSDPNAFIGGVL